MGRLALVGRWAGVYRMAVRPDVRRRGHATASLRALPVHAANHGARRTWLQVIADNRAARALYELVGFARSSGYHYPALITR
ncbi:GNAT family N-acetyltransferase [Halosaccharopolyspora lacisalsi]|uniref:GNAT family N-acetyltransferase n=1 Tax=Halosaccharopolyspora lacisalsi TaxID=1000566 RepID=UPI0038B338EF